MQVADRVFRGDTTWNLMLVQDGSVRTSVRHVLITICRFAICRWRNIFAERKLQGLFSMGFIGWERIGYRRRDGYDDEKKKIHDGDENGRIEFECYHESIEGQYCNRYFGSESFPKQETDGNNNGGLSGAYLSSCFSILDCSRAKGAKMALY